MQKKNPCLEAYFLHLMTYVTHGSHVTGMVTVQAAPFLAAHVAAAVWNLAALPLRVRHFTCNPETAAMTGNFTLK